MKIYDCSNSEASLKSKSVLYGPKENDIVRYLKQYATEFGHEFVLNSSDADVIFTNDIFPESFNGKRKVKRMDGVFSRMNTIHRNEFLNKAAREANHVIFISDYSKQAYFKLYDPDKVSIKKYSVIPNEVDPSIFYPGLNHSTSNKPKEVIAIASDWSRPEKRLDDLLVLAEMDLETYFILVGKIPNKKYPSNIRFKGYIETPQKLGDTLRMADAMISLSYKDPYPKTMLQGKYCGLPILYAASGGQPNMKVSGLPVVDFNQFTFDDDVPKLSSEELKESWNYFCSGFKNLKNFAMQYRGRNDFVRMLKNYFTILQG